MIKQLFETHLPVRDLNRAMAFYDKLPGLSLGRLEPERRIAFYFVGGWNHSMLGLWEKPVEEVRPQHLAFQIELDAMPAAIETLHTLGIMPLDFFNQPSDEPTVFAWMPAAGIYFQDPDGHLLELIAILPGEPDAEGGLMKIGDWNRRQRSC